MPLVVNNSFVITVVVFYWAYLALVALFIMLSLFNIYHLVKFGFFSAVNMLIIILYVVIAAWIIGYSISTMTQMDWSGVIFSPAWFNNIGGLVNSAVGGSSLKF